MSTLTLESSITKEHLSRLKKLLSEIEENPKSHEFREPVPWKDLGLSDYPRIIKKPMDISLCRKNLVKLRYKSFAEFFTDIQLIWKNCMQYNIENSDIYNLAADMEKVSKKCIQDAKSDLDINEKQPANSSNAGKSVNGKRRNNGENVKEPKSTPAKSQPKKDQVVEEEKEGTDASNQTQKEDDDSENNQNNNIDSDVTFEMKVKFTEKVRKLDNKGLTRLVTRVKELCKDALEDVDADKLHIQVDKIDNDSFHKLANLVDESLGKNDTSSAKDGKSTANGSTTKIASNKRQRTE